MGQYYKAINRETMEWVSPYDYNNGAKLMEHSYIGNSYVEAVEFLLIEGNRWHLKPIVWAGDYADKERGKGENLYTLAKKPSLQMLIEAVPEDYHFLINADAKEYVDKRKCPTFNDDWQIHPLPLLTADGNGRGGGDYHESSVYVGRWSGQRIALVKEIPDEYKEIEPNFIK